MSSRTVYTCDRCHGDIGFDARYALTLAFIEQEEHAESVPGVIRFDLCGYCAGQIRTGLGGPGRIFVEVPGSSE